MNEKKSVMLVVDGAGYVPKFGDTVYVIYENGIYKEKVHSLGMTAFIVEGFTADTKPSFWQWQYKDFGRLWFADLEQAQEELLSRFTDDYELVHYTNEWWEVEKV